MNDYYDIDGIKLCDGLGNSIVINDGTRLYDLETGQDIYDEEIYGEYRIFRGGGWFDEDRGCLATNRRRSHPTSFKIDDLGFRIAKSASFPASIDPRSSSINTCHAASIV